MDLQLLCYSTCTLVYDTYTYIRIQYTSDNAVLYLNVRVNVVVISYICAEAYYVFVAHVPDSVLRFLSSMFIMHENIMYHLLRRRP